MVFSNLAGLEYERPNTSPPCHSFDSIITAPIHALLTSQTLTQILLNDQSTRACAYDEPSGLCLQSGTVGKAGWTRAGWVQHEFGSLHPDHQFSYWPGFSLNPGLWDLERLRAGMAEVGVRFDVEDDRFEQSFSLRCYDVGVEVGHMAGVVVRHIGVEVSCSDAASGTYRRVHILYVANVTKTSLVAGFELRAEWDGETVRR